MSTQKPFSLLVVPDDEPPVLSGTPYEPRVRALAERVEWHFDRPASDQETIDRLKDADAVINIRSSVQFNRPVLSACSKLKILSVWGTGVDHVDLPAAKELGITVSNTPGYGAPYVSEHALTLGPWPSPARSSRTTGTCGRAAGPGVSSTSSMARPWGWSARARLAGE